MSAFALIAAQNSVARNSSIVGYNYNNAYQYQYNWVPGADRVKSLSQPEGDGTQKGGEKD